jgi:hypothetical protein
MQIALKFFFSLYILHIYMARSITISVNSFLFFLLLKRIGFLRYYVELLLTYIKKSSIYIFKYAITYNAIRKEIKLISVSILPLEKQQDICVKF